MNQRDAEAARESSTAARRGFLAFVALPSIVVLDQGLSLASGLPLRSLGAFALIPVGCLAWAAMGLVMFATRRGRRWLGCRRRGLALGTCGAIAGLAGAESLIQWARPAAPFHLRSPETAYRFAPDPKIIFGVAPRTRSSYNAQGLRGPDWSARRERLRVLCIGGSTTECYYVDDQDAWTNVLAQELTARLNEPCWVGAAAVSEMASGHHARFIATSPLVDEVDCLVVMPGANDLVRILLGLDQGDARVPTWYGLQFVQVSKNYWNVDRQNGFWADETGQRLQGVLRLGRAIPARPIDWQAETTHYAQRLVNLCVAAKHRKPRLFLVTQPYLWDQQLTPQGVKRLLWARAVPTPRPWEFLNSRDLRRVADAFNAEVVRAAREQGCELVDGAAAINGHERCFYDDFHLNDAGCVALVQTLAESIVRRMAAEPARR
ncbi:MAG: SGNH/GDSL hydrolase family protein [Pirellulales bacterium]|nr:SGNH/GDSL hydrolase family protein [Pirellulales bacterium]